MLLNWGPYLGKQSLGDGTGRGLAPCALARVQVPLTREKEIKSECKLHPPQYSICETPDDKKITRLLVLLHPESRGPNRNRKFVFGYKIVIVSPARPGG